MSDPKPEKREITHDQFKLGGPSDYVIETESGIFPLRDYQGVALRQFIQLCGFYERVGGVNPRSLMSIEVISSDLEPIGDLFTGKKCTRYYILPEYTNMRFWIHGDKDGDYFFVRDGGTSCRIFKKIGEDTKG